MFLRRGLLHKIPMIRDMRIQLGQRTFVSSHNRRILEVKKNYSFFKAISKNYPAGTYIGILNGQLVATGESYTHVADNVGCRRAELYLKSSHESGDHFISLSTLPESLIIDSGSEYCLGKTCMDWSDVAKPFLNELLEDGEMDRNFVKVRWVKDHPFCTIAVSNSQESPCYAMTFLVDSSKSTNSVKDLVFGVIGGNLTLAGEKVLFIQGKRFSFLQSDHRGFSNVNILGSGAFLELPLFSSQFWHSLQDGGTGIPREEGRISEDDQSLFE
jgi:hypothetical protein